MAEESRNGVIHAEIQNGVGAIDETDAVDSDEKMLATQIYDVVMRSVEKNKDDDYVFVENLQENPHKFSSNGDHHAQQLQNGVEEEVESCSSNNGDMEKIQTCLENGVETGDSASNFSVMKEIGDDVSVLKQNVHDFPVLKENGDDFPVLKENAGDFYLQKKNGDDSAVLKLKWGDMCDSEEDGGDSSENEGDLVENGDDLPVLRENDGDFSVLKENGDELPISVEKIAEIVDSLSKSAEKVGASGDNLTNSEENVEQDEEIGDNLTNSEANVEEVEEIGDNLSNFVEEVRESEKIENNLTDSEENVEEVEKIGDNLSNSVEEVRESEKIENNFSNSVEEVRESEKIENSFSNSVEKVTEPEENGDVSHVIDSREENSYLGAEVPEKDEEKVDYFAKDEKACDSSEDKEEDDSVDSDGVKSEEKDSEEASNADQHTEGKSEEKNIDDYEEEKPEEKISNISAEVDKKLDVEEKKSEISIEAEKNTPLDVAEKTQSEEEQGSDVSAEGQNSGASAGGGKSSDASAEGGQSSDASAEGRKDSDVSAEEGDDCDISAEEGQSSDASAEGGQSSNVSGGGGRISVVSAEEEQKSDISIEAHLEDQAFGVTDNTDEGRNSPQIISEAQSEISNDFGSENGGSLVEEEQYHQFASVKANYDTSDVQQDEVKNRQSIVNKRCLQNGKMGTNKRLSANASSFVMPNKGHVGRDFVPHELASIRFGSYNGFAGKGILQPPSASVAPPLQNGKPLYIVRVPKFNDPKLRLEIDAADKICKEKKLSQNKIRERMETQRKEKNNLYRTLKKAKDLVREKIEEMDSLQKSLNNMEKLSTVEDFDRKIHQLNHRIEHETMPLTEEKRLIVEIKKLRILKEKLSKDAASEVNDEHIDKQLQDLRQQLVALKRDVAYEENIVKSIERELQEMRMTMDDLRNQNNLAKNECDKAYDLLRRLMGKNSDLDKEARDGLNQRLRAKNHARQGDWRLADDLCNRQVEQMVQRWNADTDFRREYIKNNEKRTLDRFSTLDGRCLGPDEEPMVPSHYVGIELEAAEQEKHSAAVNTATRENGVAESEVKAAVIGKHPEGAQRIKEHDAETSMDQTNEHQHRIGRGGSSRRRPANRGKKSKKEPLPVFELEPFELTSNDKTKEVDAAENEKEIAKRKELIRQEEIRKAKEAEERKRKQAEKKRAKELAKAQKEAEKKEKERQRRANRKEDTASSVGSKDDSQAMISSPGASEVTESNASVQKQTASQRKKTATQKTKTKTVFPGAKRNKKMWQKYLGIFAGVMCCLAFIWLLFLI